MTKQSLEWLNTGIRSQRKFPAFLTPGSRETLVPLDEKKSRKCILKGSEMRSHIMLFYCIIWILT